MQLLFSVVCALSLLGDAPRQTTSSTNIGYSISIEEIAPTRDRWTKANAISSDGTVVGQGQVIVQHGPRSTDARARSRALSYFDRDNGYTNRQTIDLIGFAFLLANPRLIKDFYSSKRYEQIAAMDKRNGVQVTPNLVSGEPIVVRKERRQTLPGLVGAGQVYAPGSEDASAERSGILVGEAFGINRTGWIVGSGRSSTVDARSQAVVWLPEQPTPFCLTTAMPDVVASVAFAVNDQGTIVGEVDLGGNVVHPYRWDNVPHKGRTAFVGRKLPTLGGVSGRACAVNGTGLIAGWSENARFDIHACVWEGERVRELSLPDGMPTAYGVAINDLGHVAGYGIDSEGRILPVLWDARGRAIRLPLLAASGAITAINNRAQMVGTIQDSATSEPRAAYWEGRENLDLNALLPPNSGWILRVARGINDRGEIVGWGEHLGKTAAFRLRLTVRAH